MRKTIEITKADARELYKAALPELKKKLEGIYPKKELAANVMERITSFEDACEDQKINPADVLKYSDPKNGFERSENSDTKLKVIAKSLKEGRKLDYANKEQKNGL